MGCSRVFEVKSKKTGEIQKVDVVHNSLLIMGLKTNAEFKHSIRVDKRMTNQRRFDELIAFGHRISFTFRTIGTFLTADHRIFGQGAICKTIEKLPPTQNTHDYDQSKLMLYAFSNENKETDFDWNINYGKGFDIIDLRELVLENKKISRVLKDD